MIVFTEPELSMSCLFLGIYVCSRCDHELFSSQQKYKHSSPWPAFNETIKPDSVSKYEESPGALKVCLHKYALVRFELQLMAGDWWNILPRPGIETLGSYVSVPTVKRLWISWLEQIRSFGRFRNLEIMVMMFRRPQACWNTVESHDIYEVLQGY